MESVLDDTRRREKVRLETEQAIYKKLLGRTTEEAERIRIQQKLKNIAESLARFA